MGYPKDKDQAEREEAARAAKAEQYVNRELKRAHADRLRRRSQREDWLAVLGMLLAVFVTGAFVARVLFP